MRKNKNQDLAPAMAPGQFRRILKKLLPAGPRPPSIKLQASSSGSRRDPEFFSTKKHLTSHILHDTK